ncbi:MAG: type II secretion system protein GspK [Desulfobacter sp.]
MKGLVNNESGMALLVVMAVISVLLVGALQLARNTGEAALATGSGADRFLAREQAIAGLHLGMALLAADGEAGEETDSIQEDWARPEQVAKAVEAMGYNSESLVVEITDELGKLQINALLKQYPGREQNPDQYKLWERFLDELDPDIDPVPILNCLQDWLDSRDDEAVTGLSGAESDYYLSLDVPYTCTNGPFGHISEIFLVKDITPELFKTDRESADEEDGDSETIVPEEMITVHGLDTEDTTEGRYKYTGKVNINTAPEAVIQTLLPLGSEDLAEDLVEYREERADGGESFTNSLDKGWAAQVIQLSGKEQVAFDGLIRYDSDLFNIRSQSTRNQARTTISALIRRAKDETSGKWSCRILQVTEDI